MTVTTVRKKARLRPMGRFAMLAGLIALSLPCGASAQGTGTLRGTVTARDGGAPVFGACITFDEVSCKTLTDERGSYVLRGVPAGSVSLTVSALGLEPSRQTASVAEGQVGTLDVALSPGPLLINGFVVTATRLATEASRVATTVHVLNAEQIQESPARETQDMLREIPGVELPRTSSLVGGTAQIVSIRGVDEGRTAVLFDGIPIGDAWGEWIDWGRVPKGMLDRVEVVEGGTSNLYGSGAIGGVINFFSRPTPAGSGTLTLDGGSREARHAYLGMGVPIAGALSGIVNLDFQSGGGYTLLDPAKRGAVDVTSEIIQRNGYTRLTYAPSARWSAFTTGHLFSDTRHTGTPLGRQTRDEKSLDFGFNAGVARGQLALRGWTTKQTERQRAGAVRANSATCAGAPTAPRACEDLSSTAVIPSRDWGASALWSLNDLPGFQSVSVGADFRHMDGSYDETTYNTTCPGANCGKVTRTVESGGDQNLSGAFVQAVAAPVDPIRVELGLRFDSWQNDNAHSNDPIAGDVTYPDRSKAAWSPRVGLSARVSSRLSAHGAFYQAFRAPNLAELYRKQINANASQITLPNPDLKDESGRGWEGGLDWRPFDWIEAKGSYYVADYKDFNVPVVIAAGPPSVRQRKNINKARSQGGGGSVALRPLPGLTLSGGLMVDNAKVVAKDSTNGQRINRVPSPRHTIRATYSSPRLGTWTGLWRHEGTTTTLQGLQLPPFAVFDASAQRSLMEGLLVFVNLENITDEKYQVNVSGTGAAALISYGLPRTLRVGATLSR